MLRGPKQLQHSLK